MAFCFAGNYDNDQLSDAQIASFTRWWQVFLARSPQATNMTYHQAGAALVGNPPTACPGQNIISRIEGGTIFVPTSGLSLIPDVLPSGTITLGGRTGTQTVR